MQLSDYTIDPSSLDLADALQTWAWLLPAEVRVFMMNRFGDLFLKFDDGSIHLLAMDSDSLQKVGSSVDEFARLIEEPANFNDWLLVPLVDKLTQAGRLLGKGQCYGFLVLPNLGGTYDLENIIQKDIAQYVRFVGQVYSRTKDLPDGTRVRIRVGS